MKTLIIDKGYVTSVANKNQGVWIEHSDTTLADRQHWNYASYRRQYPNIHHPKLTDGIGIDIVSYQHKRYLADCELVMPWGARDGNNSREVFDTFEEAKTFALDWLDRALRTMQREIQQYIAGAQNILHDLQPLTEIEINPCEVECPSSTN